MFPDGALDEVLMWAGLATMIMGYPRRHGPERHQAIAVVHPGVAHRLHDLRHRPERTGLSGAIFYTGPHLVQTAFLVVGLIERQAGSSSLRRLGGLAKASLLAQRTWCPP